MDVSIVLVSFNTKQLTRECIESIYEKTSGPDYDIWVVDNASHDGSAEMIEREFPGVNLIKSPENLGFGRANNLAIEKTGAKYVFLLNTDTVLLNNAVKILFDFMEKPGNEDIGACGGQLYNSDMSLQGSVGEFFDLDKLYKKCIGINFTAIKHRNKKIFNRHVLKKDQQKRLSPYEPDYIIGADLMLRKSALDKAGTFDERFFMFGEEAELCFRIRKNGYRIMFVPEAQILHYGGSSAYSHNRPLEVEKMLLKSSILFFRIVYGEEAAKKAKLFHIIYYLRYLPLRFFSIKAFRRLKMALEV